MKLLLWFVSGIKTLPEVWFGFKKDNQKKRSCIGLRFFYFSGH